MVWPVRYGKTAKSADVGNLIFFCFCWEPVNGPSEHWPRNVWQCCLLVLCWVKFGLYTIEKCAPRHKHQFYTFLVMLKKLYIYKNILDKLTPGVFKYLQALKILDLDSNTLRYLERGTFLGLVNLKELRLANNCLIVILEGSLYGFGQNNMKVTLYNNKKLQSLSWKVFTNGNLSSIPSMTVELGKIHFSCSQICWLNNTIGSLRFNYEEFKQLRCPPSLYCQGEKKKYWS